MAFIRDVYVRYNYNLLSNILQGNDWEIFMSVIQYILIFNHSRKGHSLCCGVSTILINPDYVILFILPIDIEQVTILLTKRIMLLQEKLGMDPLYTRIVLMVSLLLFDLLSSLSK